MADFRSYVYVTDKDGEDWEIDVRVSYDAIYQPERISGPPEDCYPAESEMDLTAIESVDDLPPGITDEMIVIAGMAADDRLTLEAWDDYFKGGDK